MITIKLEDILYVKKALDALMALNRNSTSDDIHHAKMQAISAEVFVDIVLRRLGSIELEVTTK